MLASQDVVRLVVSRLDGAQVGWYSTIVSKGFLAERIYYLYFEARRGTSRVVQLYPKVSSPKVPRAYFLYKSFSCLRINLNRPHLDVAALINVDAPVYITPGDSRPEGEQVGW